MGATLVEFMVASGVAAILAITIGNALMYGARSYAALANYNELDNLSRNALDTLVSQIRASKHLKVYETTRIVMQDSDDIDLEFKYDSTAKTLTRTKSGVSKILLKECDTLRFDIFQRNPIGGTYNQYATADPATCKLVQVNWVCSRKIMNRAVNTESVQTAKIVIRNQHL